MRNFQSLETGLQWLEIISADFPDIGEKFPMAGKFSLQSVLVFS